MDRKKKKQPTGRWRQYLKYNAVMQIYVLGSEPMHWNAFQEANIDNYIRKGTTSGLFCS